MGVERLAMLRYGVNDLRLFFENDLRFLQLMANQAAIALAAELRFLADRPQDPAPAVAPGTSMGSGMDPNALRAFAAECDVVTFDHDPWPIGGAIA